MSDREVLSRWFDYFCFSSRIGACLIPSVDPPTRSSSDGRKIALFASWRNDGGGRKTAAAMFCQLRRSFTDIESFLTPAPATDATRKN